jgi:uncharacterized protein RhaS with RHS repeats
LTPDPIGLSGGINLFSYVQNDPVNLIDPSGLYSTGEFIQDAANVSAGFGDTISFGMTDLIRDQMGTNDAVDKCSGSYTAGEIGGYAWFAATTWTGGLSGGSGSVFWSGEGAMARAANYGTILEKTPIGSVLNRLGDKVPYAVWKAASGTFAGNAKGTVIKVGAKQGNIWRTLEKPILNWRKIQIRNIP